MNLARALEQSADEMPPVRLQVGLPRMHPNLVVRHHYERDGHYYSALIPGGKPPHFFRFNERQWQVASLCNGQRNADQVARIATAKWGIHVRAEDVQTLIDVLEREQFWYRTPHEESVALCQNLMQKRQQRIKADHGDLSQIILTSFNPDKFLAWVERHFSWMYSRWFFIWSLFMVVVMFVILGSHWSQVWADSVNYYKLTGRGFIHFLKFLGVFTVLAVIHESAHGLTCKHVGGQVHRMGFNLVYMAPCVFCDVSEAWVYGGRRERMLTVFAGVWSEIILCTYATVIWWATPPGTFLHDASYLVILAGGIFCVLVNWNPLAKMDGYIMLTEYLRIRDVKVVATNWFIAWIRQHIFHLPAKVERISRVRAVSYAVYAVLAGMYSYFLLLFFCRVLYHILYFYTPQWAFLPATLLGLRIFRGRIHKFGLFMKELYFAKKQWLLAQRPALLVGAAVLLILGVLPIRRERVTERFVLEPVRRSVLRAQVSGLVTDVGVAEGQHVNQGAPIASLRDLSVDTEAAKAEADYDSARALSLNAQLKYARYGEAEQQLREARQRLALAHDKQERLVITSPIAGTVVTPRVRDVLGTYVKEGTLIAEVADTSTVRARIFIPEHEMKKLRKIDSISIRVDSSWTSVRARMVAFSPAAELPDSGLLADAGYQGMKLPDFFALIADVPNSSGTFRDGMTGTAQIYGERKALLTTVLDPLITAIARRLW